jgi:3-oxoacyl-[acyl-carrier protein] reductase
MSESTTPSQTALVTGATRGIGAAIAAELAARGLRVIGTATTDEGAARITEALSAHGGRGVKLNVTDGAAVDALVDAIVKEHGGLHVLVNNAGITRDTLAMRMKDDDWDAVLDTNLKAVFRVSRAAIRPMMKQRFGRIISITSVVGASGNPGQANYAAAKAGVAGMTRALARELPRHHGELRGPRLHRHRHDGRPARRTEEGPQIPDRHGGSGAAERHCACGRLPRIAGRWLCDGAGIARQWRHVHVVEAN